VSESVNNALLLRAPETGTILTQRPQDLVGSSVTGGAPLFTLGDTRRMRVEMPVTERLIQSMRVGEPVSIRVPSFPYRKYRTTISAIAPAAEAIPATLHASEVRRGPGETPERFVAVAFLDNADNALRSGMTADAKLQGRRVPYAVQWWRVFYHWTRRIFW
jgi:HlyD family secretion protein